LRLGILQYYRDAAPKPATSPPLTAPVRERRH